MMRSLPRVLFWLLPAALGIVVLLPRSATAAGAHALVIGESSYAGVAALPNCRDAADVVAIRFRRLGFAVDEVVDAPSGELRVAINRLARDVATMPGEPSVIYICAEATIMDQRIFLLPSDVDLQLPFDPETQGVVVPALLNAMQESDGTLFGDLTMQSRADVSPALEALRSRLSTGLHLALTMTRAPYAGAIGRFIADSATSPVSGWDALVPALRAHVDKGAVAVEPAPALLPVPAAAPAPTAAPASAPPAPATKISSAPVSATASASAAPPTPARPELVAPEPVVAVPQAPPETAVAPALHAKPRRAPQYARRSNLRVARLQSALRDHGLYSGSSDGVMSTRTIMAIRAYQISIGKPSSGTLTVPEVIQLLNSQ